MKFSIICFAFLAVASMLQPWVFSQSYFNNEIQQEFSTTNCQQSMESCIRSHSKGNVFAYVRRYCKLFDLQQPTTGYANFSECMLSSGCSGQETNKIKQFVCVTSPDMDDKVDAMIDAMESTSLRCQKQITDCVSISPAAPTLLIEKQFCDLINLKEFGTSTQECLVQTCSLSEYYDMQDVACGAGFALASIVLLIVSLAMSGLAAKL